MSSYLNSKTIVFIHGLFMNPASWETWIKYFEEKGYKCYAPAYPFHEGEPSFLRTKINPELGKVTFGQVIKSLAAFIDRLSEKPVLIGHSMGWSFLRANLPTINPLKGNSVCLPGVKWYNYAFCNTMTIEQTEIEFNKFVVPESRNIPRSSTKNEGKIDFKKPHDPLLIIAGEKDHIVPSSLNRKNFNAYSDKNSKRDFKEFEGRTHYICGQKNWKEVADYSFNWIISLSVE